MKRVAGCIVASAILLLTSILPPRVAAQHSSSAVSLEKVASDPGTGITEYKLHPNGLQVLLAERHYSPIVTTMVVYHVGSRNEAVGYTGSTHFLEHMMFRGTAKHDPLKHTGIDDVLKPLGGLNNATTYYDRTYYYNISPAQYLGTLLELEADRMRHALLRQSDQKSEMTVVRNELERNEDDPGRLMDVNLFAQAYQAHPYHHPVIGWRSDVENVPIQRLRKFYDDFYYPNNATLIVIGDFKTSDALKQIEKSFGSVPASPRPFPPVYTSEPAQQGQRRFTVQRGEDLPKVVLGFHTPKAVDKDQYPLEVASAILGDDKKQSSRLYKSLVDPGLASDTYAYNYSLKDPAMFSIVATATPKTPSEKIEKTIYGEMQKLATQPVPADELDKAKKSVWKRLRLDSADPVGMASQLAEAVAVADWHWWVNFRKNIEAVSAADVQRVAAKYFNERNETVGYYYPVKEPSTNAPAEQSSPGPQGLLDVPAATVEPDSVLAVAQADNGSKPGRGATRVVASTVGTVPGGTTIASRVRKKVLPNGMTVMVMPVPGSGVVAISGKIKAGDYFHPANFRSVPDYTADMLDKGSAHYTKEQLAKELELMGTSLDFNSNNFWMQFESDVVTDDLPKYLNMLADTLENPLFLPEELEKQRKQRDAELRAAMNDTDQVASNALYRDLYKPECVYYQQPFQEQLDENGKVTTDAIKQFHKAHVSPANTVIAIVGDIDVDKAMSEVEQNFGGWKGGPADKIDLGNCAVDGVKARTITNPLKDKTNVAVLMGLPSPLYISSPDFYAASVANAALGHDTISSRLAEVRNKYGYTYGISSYFGENAYTNGPWVIDFSVAPENLNKALPVVRQIVTDFAKNGMTQQELTDEGKRLSGEYILERMRTPRQLADGITKYEILGLGPQFMDNYAKNVQSVKLNEANAAIRKYFHVDKMVTSVAGTVEK